MIIWGGKEICLGKQPSEVTYWTKGKFIVTDPKVQLPHLACSRMSFSGLNPPFPIFILCTTFPLFFRERVSCNLFWTGNKLTVQLRMILKFYSCASTSWIFGFQEHHHVWLLWAGLPQWLTSWSRARFLSYPEISLRAATFQSFPELFCFV